MTYPSAPVPWRWPVLAGGLGLLLLGLALLIWPAAIAAFFYTVLGVLLLVYGIERIASGLRDPHPPFRTRKLIAGGVSLVAGLAAVSNPLLGLWLVPGVLVIVIGLAAALNGVLQLTQFRARDAAGRIQYRWRSLVLGIFKIGIGVLILLHPDDSSLLLLRIVGAWILVGGAVLIAWGARMQTAD